MSDKAHTPLSPEIRATLPNVNVDDLLASIKYYVDEDYAHLWIKDQAVCLQCKDKPCMAFCPVAVYRVDKQGHTMVGYQACVECGSCRVGCPYHNIGWTLPRGGNGVAYKFG